MTNIVNENTKTIAGIAIKTSNADAMNSIPELWGKFYSEGVAQRLSGNASDDVYAVYTDFENEGENNDGTYTFLIGVEVSSDSVQAAEFDIATIEESNYFKFDVPEKAPENVFVTWQQIWENDGLGKTFKCDFERYQKNGEISINVGTSMSL